MLIKIYFISIIVMSIISFILYGVDKVQALNNNPRIKEKVLLMMSVLNGAIGSLLGRIVFRHKTQKFYFSFIIWLSLLCQILIGLIMIFKLL